METEQEEDDPFDTFKKGYDQLGLDEIRADMNRRYETGNAYPNPSYWIHAHHLGLEKAFLELVSDKVDGKRVLEIGCGSGGIAAHHFKSAEYTRATDLSKSALEIARDFFINDPRIEFRECPAEEIDCDDESLPGQACHV